jgi:hypothetical protein
MFENAFLLLPAIQDERYEHRPSCLAWPSRRPETQPRLAGNWGNPFLKLAVSVVSCQCRQVEFETLSGGGSDLPPLQLQGKKFISAYPRVNPGLCFLGHFGPQIGHEPRYPFVTSVTSVRCFLRSPGFRP